MKTKLLSILLVICMAAAMLAGCAGGETASPSASAKPTASAAPSAAPSASAAPAPEGEYGGTLKLSAAMFSNDFCPFTYNRQSDIIAAPAVESLGLIQLDGSVQGLLVEDFIVDAKALTLTMKVRQGIKFSDGSDWNADILLWHLDMFKEQGALTKLCDATGWEKTDDYTVVVHFDKYSTEWLINYPILRMTSKAVYDKEGLEYLQTHAVGTGPFIMTDYVQGNSVTYKKNENYWQEGLPYLDGIEITLIADTNTQLSAMLNAEIDYLTTNLGSIKTQLDAAAPSIAMIAGKNPTLANIMIVMMNTADESSPFSDVKVRRAAYMAIDRQSSGVALTEGMADGLNQYAAPGSYAYIEDEKTLYSTYDYDPAAAKALLAEAGYPNGFDNKVYVSSNREKQAVSIKSYLDAIGINTQVQLEDASSNTENQRSGIWDYMLIMNCSMTSFDYCYSYNRYFTGVRTFGKNSMKTFEDFDKLVDATSVCTDTDELIKNTQECNKWISENLPVLPWYVSYTYRYGQANLRGYEQFVSSGNSQSFAWTYFAK